MIRRGKLSTGTWLWPAVAILMLGGIVAEARTHLKPADADKHLEQCRLAILAVPTTIVGPYGTWSGSGAGAEIPAAATNLLHPNVILSRKYVRAGDEAESVSFLIVDCGDARDLQGHYPPNCYPAQGQNKISSTPRIWHLKDMDVSGIEYHFAPRDQVGDEEVVYNFFVTPHVPGAMVSHHKLDGVICPDMDSIYASGEDYQRRWFGAAEFQLVSTVQMSQEQRDNAFIDLLSPNENVIRTLENRGPGDK
jgi:hypothetical protein